jgi:hypothetical protein
VLTATDNEIEALSPALAQLSALTELNLRCGISSTPRVPLQYPCTAPCSTPTVPLQYPCSTPAVPLEYPYSTPLSTPEYPLEYP